MGNVVVIGAGIAGLTAALYCARANLKPVVIAGNAEGGQLMLTTAVENYPGFPEGVLGPELIQRCKEQAKKFGARFADSDATAFRAKKDSGNKNYFEIATDSETFRAKAVIIATGASPRMLGLESEKKYFGKGAHTCATCDGYFYKDKDVIVVGGGDSACEESLFLANLVKSVTIVHRRDTLKASKIMQDRVFKNSKIKVVWNSVVDEIVGDGRRVTAVSVKNVASNQLSKIKTDAVFLAIGHIPNSSLFKGVVEMDELGFIKTDSRTRTNVPGLFACGDVQDRIYRQAVTAAGSGCQAAIEVERYLESV